MANQASTSGKDTKLLGVRLDRELHSRARRAAFDEDRPLSDLVRDALESYLSKNGKKRKTRASA